MPQLISQGTVRLQRIVHQVACLRRRFPKHAPYSTRAASPEGTFPPPNYLLYPMLRRLKDEGKKNLGGFGPGEPYVRGVPVISAISVLLTCCGTTRTGNRVVDYGVRLRIKGDRKAFFFRKLGELAFEIDSIARRSRSEIRNQTTPQYATHSRRSSSTYQLLSTTDSPAVIPLAGSIQGGSPFTLLCACRVLFVALRTSRLR